MMMMEFDLKEVFSILDENNEGQIQLRRFVDVANNYYSDAEVSSVAVVVQEQRQLFVRCEKIRILVLCLPELRLDHQDMSIE